VAGERVLVVDDDGDVRELTSTLLRHAGYEVVEAPDGREALRCLYQRPVDAIVLDVSMPDLDGWQTLERIRDVSDVPVLMLTARAGELEKVRGLQSGADDYVTKPYGRQELLARVEAMLRRSGSRTEPADIVQRGDLEVDLRQRLVRVGGEEVRLTPTEFKVLAVFVRNPNQVLSRDQLLEDVWGGAGGDEQVKLYIGYLRRKLPSVRIETVRGFGYRFVT
jgi:DNA-binding response OmpR family regulator